MCMAYTYQHRQSRLLAEKEMKLHAANVHTQTASELGFDRVLGLEWAYRPRRGKGRDPVTGLS